LVVRCSQVGINPSPVPRTLVVKALGLPEVTRLGLVCELFGNMLARELGVTTPTPGLVDIDEDTADALNGSLAPRGLSIQPGLAVGCTYLRPLLPFGGSLSDEITAEIPRLYGFDLAVQNPDRRVTNPNCAIFDNQLLAYDVGNALEAWEVSKHGLAVQHLMYPRLRGKSPSWQPLMTALQQLTVERLDQLITHLPVAWHADVARIRSHMLSLLGALPEFQAELQESVA
jgi:hypothetical protein